MDHRIRDLEQVKEMVRSEWPLEKVIEGIYNIKLSSAGQDRKAICPFHQDTDPSLGVSITKQVFYCYGCQEAGDVFRFVQLMEDISFMAALRKLAASANLDLSAYEEDPTKEELALYRLLKLNEQVTKWAQGASKIFDRWVQGRQMDTNVLKEYGIGFAAKVPPVDVDKETRESLQFNKTGKWNGRIVVPLRDEYGRCCGFRTRSVDGSAPKVHGPDADHPLSIPILYGLWEARKAIRAAGHVILVEGEPDVWQMRAFGYDNVASTLGNHFNIEQAKVLVELGVRRVVLMPDGDKGGRLLAMKTSKFRYPGLDVRIAALPNGDPDETLLRAPDEVAIALAGARHVLEYAIGFIFRQHDDITQITTKMDILHEMREVLVDIPEVERKIAYHYMAAHLGLTEDDLADYYRTVSVTDRLHNVGAEKIALARGLHDERYLGDLILQIRPGDLFLNRHRRIFDSMSRLYRLSEKVTVEVVALDLENRRMIQDASYVRSLAGTPVEGGEFVLSDIRDKAMRRAVQRTATDMASRIADTTQDGQSLLQGFSSQLASVVAGSGQQLIESDELVREQIATMHIRIANPHLIVGLDMGPEWFTLNHTLHGLQAGRYLVLAAPSGVGKTAIAVSWLRRFAIDLNEPCLYLTFETGPEALNLRLMAAVSGVEMDKITTGFLTVEEIEMVYEAGQVIAAAPIIMTGRGQIAEEAQSLIRHDWLKRKTAVVFVDYLQLMSVANPAGLSRYLEIGKISRMLLELSQEYGIRVIALAQINREGAKKSRSSGLDLGDSFIPFQDSDIFLVVNEKDDDEVAEQGIEAGNRSMLVDKHRHGRDKQRCSLMFDKGTMHIYEVRRKNGQNESGSAVEH